MDRVPDHEDVRRRFTGAALWGLAIALVPYLWVLWNGRLDPLRTAVPERTFSNFYDLQARALFHGHWWVPKGSLGIEAFVVDGRDYMYFPPFPAFLRMPVLAITDGLDGKLTALSLLVSWLVTGLFLILVLWRVRVLMRGSAPMRRAEAASVGMLVATILSGSVLLFLASTPSVYEEAFAWGVALSVGSMFALAGVLERPSAMRVLATGALSAGAVLSRTTIGWGCVVAIVIAACWFALGRGGEEQRRWWLPLLVAALVPVGIGASITFAKFGNLFMHPLGAQVFSKVNFHRSHVLAENGGSLLSLDFLPSTALAYFRPDGLRLTSLFPFVTFPGTPAQGVAGVVLDQTYRTGSVPTTMPLLFLLSAWGTITAFRRRAVGRVVLLRIPIIGTAAALVGVLVYGYIAPRYLADFLPFLVLASTIALVDLWRRAESWKRRTRAGFLAAIAVVGALGVAVNLAVATSAEQLASGLRRARDYVETQQGVDELLGGSLDDDVVIRDQLPRVAPPDRLFVIGDCDALYVSTGDSYDPWVAAELRDVELDVSFHDPAPGRRRVRVLEVGDNPSRSPSSFVAVQGDGSGRIRFLLDLPYLQVVGRWLPLRVGRTYRVRVVPDPDIRFFLVDVDGRRLGKLPQFGTDINSYNVVHRASVIRPTAAPGDPPLPLTVDARTTPKPPLCRSLTSPTRD